MLIVAPSDENKYLVLPAAIWTRIALAISVDPALAIVKSDKQILALSGEPGVPLETSLYLIPHVNC